MDITTIGLDLAKHWFQVHSVDAAGKVVVKRRLRRAEVGEFFRRQAPCLVGMEACAAIRPSPQASAASGSYKATIPSTSPAFALETNNRAKSWGSRAKARLPGFMARTRAGRSTSAKTWGSTNSPPNRSKAPAKAGKPPC